MTVSLLSLLFYYTKIFKNTMKLQKEVLKWVLFKRRA